MKSKKSLKKYPGGGGVDSMTIHDSKKRLENFYKSSAKPPIRLSPVKAQPSASLKKGGSVGKKKK